MTSNKPRVNDALFELAGGGGIPVDSGQPKPEMPVAYGHCPLHSQHPPRATGLVRSGKHLTYKVHYYRIPRRNPHPMPRQRGAAMRIGRQPCRPRSLRHQNTDLPMRWDTVMTAHDVARELRDLITGEILGAERSQQTQIGPSQLGTTCTRCLVHGLAETPRGPRGQAVVRAAQQAHHTDDINAIVRRYRLAMQNLPATLDLADEDRASLAVAAWIADNVEHPRT